MGLIMIVFAAVLCLGFYQYYYRKNWNKGLNAEVNFDCNELREGDYAGITERVENHKWLAIPTLLVSYSLDRSIVYAKKEGTLSTDRQYRSDCLSIMPYRRVEHNFDIHCTKRGRYVIGKVDLVAMDLFFSKRFPGETESTSELYVLPKRTYAPELEAPFLRIIGEFSSRRFLYEDPFEWCGIRDYEPGDPMQKVNWRAYARSGEMKVNQFQDQAGIKILLMLNMEPDGSFGEEELKEEAIRIAATYLERFISKGMEVRMVTNALDSITGEEIVINQGAGKGYYCAAIRKLAAVDERKHSKGFEEVLRQEANAEENCCILIGGCQKEAIRKEYAAFLSKKRFGEWIVPINASTPRRAQAGNCHITYRLV